MPEPLSREREAEKPYTRAAATFSAVTMPLLNAATVRTTCLTCHDQTCP